MKDLRMLPIVTGFGLFILGWVVAYSMMSSPDRELLSQIVGEELDKRHTQGMRGHSELTQKMAQIESKMSSLFNATEQASNATIADPSLTLSILAKINELEKQLASLEPVSSNSNRSGEDIVKYEDNKNQLISQKSENNEILHYQTLEDDFQSEEQDLQWSLAVNDKIKTTLDEFRQETNSSTSIIGMDCKTTLCRIEMTYDKKDDMSMFEMNLISSLSSEVSESSSKFVTDNAGNISSIVVYLARKGHSVARAKFDSE